jgi:hypothetical protein
MARKAFDVVNYKLDTLCEAFEISSPIKHRAGEDARRCAELFLKMMEIAKVDLDVFSDCRSTLRKKTISSETYEEFIEDPFLVYSDKKLKDITAKEGCIDENNFFFGKRVAVFGEFTPYHRAELWQKIADIGGVPQQTITQKTDIIVIGESADAKVLMKQKELADKGIQIEVINSAEFLKRYTANTPDNHFKGKNVCIASSLKLGRDRVARYLCDCGAILQPRTTMKTDIVIEDTDYETSNTTTAKRYVSEKGLPIEIIYTDKLLEITPKEVISDYGFRVPTKRTEEKVNSASIVVNMPPQQTSPNNPYEYFGNQPNDTTKTVKQPQTQQKSGCLGVLLLLIILGTIAII